MPGIKFTERELVILGRWAEGHRIDQIAAECSISKHTVRMHLRKMRLKLNVSRTFDVYRYARDNNLIR